MFWNDSRIKALNPAIAPYLPGRRINLIYRTDSSGTINTFVRALKSFDSQFPLEPSDKPAWPWIGQGPPCPSVVVDPSDPDLPSGYACPAEGSDQVVAQLLFHPYSIGVVSMPNLAQQNISTFSLKNRFDRTVVPDSQSVQRALAFGMSQGSMLMPNLDSRSSPIGNMLFAIDAADPDAWPIIELNYFMVPNILSQDCGRALDLAQFMIWAIADQSAVDIMTEIGFTPLSASIYSVIIDQITDLNCGTLNSSTKVFAALFPDEIALLTLGSAFAFAFFACGVFIVLNRDHPAIVRHGSWILSFQAFGCAANCLTVFLFTGFPNQVCCSHSDSF